MEYWLQELTYILDMILSKYSLQTGVTHYSYFLRCACAQDQAQDITHVRHVFCHWSTSPAHFITFMLLFEAKDVDLDGS